MSEFFEFYLTSFQKYVKQISSTKCFVKNQTFNCPYNQNESEAYYNHGSQTTQAPSYFMLKFFKGHICKYLEIF